MQEEKKMPHKTHRNVHGEQKNIKTKNQAQEHTLGMCACKKIIQGYKEQVEEHLHGWKRAQADYQNLLKSTIRERENVLANAKKECVTQFLPLYTNILRALEHIPQELEDNEWAKGIAQIQKQFEEVLKKFKVERIAIEEGVTMFDHTHHEALSQEKESTHNSGVVVKEVAPGYRIGSEVIMAAQVVVAE